MGKKGLREEGWEWIFSRWERIIRLMRSEEKRNNGRVRNGDGKNRMKIIWRWEELSKKRIFEKEK